DGASSSAKDLNMPAARVTEKIFQVAEKLQMPTLVRGDGDGMGVFFNGAFYYFVDAPVMPQVDDLRAFGLEDPAHDIDGGIMAVKEGRGRDDPDSWWYNG